MCTDCLLYNECEVRKTLVDAAQSGALLDALRAFAPNGEASDAEALQREVHEPFFFGNGFCWPFICFSWRQCLCDSVRAIPSVGFLVMLQVALTICNALGWNARGRVAWRQG